MQGSPLSAPAEPQPWTASRDVLPIRTQPGPAAGSGATGREPAVDAAGWIEKIRDGDRAAFAALFRAYYGPLCGIVSRRIGSRDLAEELVQEVFVRVWVRRGTLDPALPIDRYLYRAAKNRALDHLRHLQVADRAREVLASVPCAPAPSADDRVRSREISSAARRIVDHLPERCRHVFLLSREGGLTYAEIADLLEISVKTVEKQMGRALKELRSGLRAYLS